MTRLIDNPLVITTPSLLHTVNLYFLGLKVVYVKCLLFVLVDIFTLRLDYYHELLHLTTKLYFMNVGSTTDVFMSDRLQERRVYVYYEKGDMTYPIFIENILKLKFLVKFL